MTTGTTMSTTSIHVTLPQALKDGEPDRQGFVTRL
jgi:hypothetical protein